MKIDGALFITARKKFRARYPGRGEQGNPAPGTQEWVADQARVSLRAVQYLENGEASLRTIKAVSQLLGITDWEEHVLDYGAEYVTCLAKRMIDFRPEHYPPHHPGSFHQSTLLMTLDPISITVEPGKFAGVWLKEVTAILKGLPTPMFFTGLAEVLLTPAGKGWLGWVEEMEERYLPANGEPIHIPIMFRQTDIPQMTWGGFVAMVEATAASQFEVECCLHFTNFQKRIKVYVSTDLLQRLFSEGRKKHQSEFPYRVQLRTIT